MFLITPKFKDVKNYIGPGLSYDAWCMSMGCRLQKLMFPYEWLDSHEKLSQVVPVGYEDFYSSIKATIAKDEYEQFVNMFKANIAQQWVIGCEYKTLQTLCHLLRPSGKWPSHTILIRLMYAETQLASHAMYINDIHTEQSLENHIHQEACITYVKINEKRFSTVVVMVP